jgi:hypothetical protein
VILQKLGTAWSWAFSFKVSLIFLVCSKFKCQWKITVLDHGFCFPFQPT